MSKSRGRRLGGSPSFYIDPAQESQQDIGFSLLTEVTFQADAVERGSSAERDLNTSKSAAEFLSDLMSALHFVGYRGHNPLSHACGRKSGDQR